LSFAEELVRKQPWRSQPLADGSSSFARVVTFLTDSVHIIFFECAFAVKLLGQLSVELYSLGESSPLLLRGQGGAFVAGLACTEPGCIGYGMPACVVGGNAAELRTYLGMGATASGFAAMWQGEPVVVKIMRPSLDNSLAIDMEENVLRALDTVPGIVKLVAREGPLFLLKPLGVVSYSISASDAITNELEAGHSVLWSMNDSQPSDIHSLLHEAVLPMAADFCALVDALALMHKAGFVHRDPRPENFFRSASGEFFVADLGSAIAIGGTADGDLRPFGFSYGPAAVLSALAARIPLPAALPEHDMEQVARLVYAAHARDGKKLPVFAPAAQLLGWWRLRDELQPLATLLALAQDACAGDIALDAFKAAIRRTLL
jgi:serine/threonine protein kinase